MKGLALFQKLLSLMLYGALVAQMLTTVDKGVCRYPHTPGIHKKEQVEAWKPVVKVCAALGALLPCTYSLKMTSATAGRCFSTCFWSAGCAREGGPVCVPALARWPRLAPGCAPKSNWLETHEVCFYVCLPAPTFVSNTAVL